MKPLRVSLLSLASVGLFCTAAPGQEGWDPGWDPEIIDLFSRIPVQEGGRVKPLESLASFTLLGMHGKRSLTTLRGDRLNPLQWFLNTVLLSEDARQQLLFKVPDSQTIENVAALRL